MRSTKIVCTLGPATAGIPNILKLARLGMNVARLNFSHGELSDHLRTLRNIQEVNRKNGLHIATLLDTKGAEIRTGDVKKPIVVAPGDVVVFSSTPLPHEKHPVIHVSYRGFHRDVRGTKLILLDNGEITFSVKKIRSDGGVVATAIDAGSIGSRRRINVPGADIHLPSIIDEDWRDLAFGIEHAMDFTALSFVRKAKDVNDVRAFLRKHKSDMRIIAKIEARQAIDDLDAIIEASDGIMVARGDLGAEIPFERIPAIQDDIVLRCHCVGKPCIVATHMLESMIVHPMPTRAEVTDVAHAVWTQTDATMLSGETAMGRHPFQAVEAMTRILQETESNYAKNPRLPEVPVVGDLEAKAQSAVTLSGSSQASAIIVFTHDGKAAEALSKFRPSIPVFAFCGSLAVLRSLQMSFGVHGILLPFTKETPAVHKAALALCRKKGYLKKGQKTVMFSEYSEDDQVDLLRA